MTAKHTYDQRSDSYEKERVSRLVQTGLLDSKAEESFDSITKLASQIFNAPIALVSLVDSDRQWFKSHYGLDATETEREFSFCSHAISRNEVMVIEDALQDSRFSTNPLVTGHPNIRFYAGAPLILPSGHALGSLCIIDQEPRTFSDREKETLATLATFVMAQIDIFRRASRVNENTLLANQTQMAEDLERKMLLTPGDSCGLALIEVLSQEKFQDAARSVGINPVRSLLQIIADKICAACGPDLPVYHVGEAWFAVQTTGHDREQKEAFCRNLLNELDQPFDSLGVQVQLDTVAGLIEFELTVNSVEDSLRKATSALLEAIAHREKIRWHNESLDAAHARAFQLMRDIPVGLQRGEFRLVYQPKLNCSENQYTGVEALARWRHPELGDISPGEFVPLVEKTALIHPFTHWVLNESLKQIAIWHQEGIFLTVAINVSSRNLDDFGFVEIVKSSCSRFNVNPKWLHVECTENAILTNNETIAALTSLEKLGVGISLDDFGIGYSNISCLRDLPIQLLKLDQSLIKPIESEAPAYIITTGLINLGHALGYRVLAEGVETEKTFSMLLAAGCDAVQGYYFARPMEAENIPDFVKAKYVN